MEEKKEVHKEYKLVKEFEHSIKNTKNGEETYLIKIQANDTDALLRLQRPFIRAVWTAKISKPDMDGQEWKVLNNLDTLCKFWIYAINNGKVKIDEANGTEKSIYLVFEYEMAFENKIVQELNLIAYLGDLNWEMAVDDLLKQMGVLCEENKSLKKSLNSLEAKYENSKFSSIMTLNDIALIKMWIKPSDPESVNDFDLKYRATLHQFTAVAFREKCKGCCPTLTIIKSHLGYKFGGFTNYKWSDGGAGGCVPDATKPFTFSLTHGEKCEALADTNNIYDEINSGPSFGNKEIYLPDKSSTTVDGASCNGGVSYKLPEDKKSFAKTFYAGSEFFFATEIEVFQITYKPTTEMKKEEAKK